MKGKRYLFILLFYLWGTTLLAQIVIKDSISGNPISSAHIIDSKGRIIGTSNMDGVLPHLKPNTVVTIQHISYQPRTVRVGKENNAFLLSPITYSLSETTIQAKKTDYIRLTGYFRSYQLNDSIIKYFKEGTFVFYYSVKGKKGKRFIIDSREMQNKQLVSLDKRTSFYVQDYYLAMPYFEQQSFLKEHRTLLSFQNVHPYLTNIMYEHRPIGYIRKDSIMGTFLVEYDCHQIAEKTSLTLFGYTVKIDAHRNTELQRSSDGEFVDSYYNLLNRSVFRRLFYKHKKMEKFQQVEVIDDIYLYSHQYMSKEEVEREIRQVSYVPNRKDMEQFKSSHVPALPQEWLLLLSEKEKK